MGYHSPCNNGKEEIKIMLKIPHNYFEWSEVLDAFKNKEYDDDILDVMKKGTLEWQTGVAERFAQKLVDAVNYRMNMATDKFQRDMKHSNGSEGNIIRALLALRRELSFLTKAIDLPVLPEKDRYKYVALVIQQADSIQNSLEESAKQDKSGKLSSIIRNNKVNAL